MTATLQSLVGKYTLSNLNDKKVDLTQGKAPFLEFKEAGDKLRVHAKVANTMNGVLNYANGKLSGMMMSTRMRGPPFQMEVEGALAKGFESGMTVTREGDNLVLSHGDNTLDFVLDRSEIECK